MMVVLGTMTAKADETVPFNKELSERVVLANKLKSDFQREFSKVLVTVDKDHQTLLVSGPASMIAEVKDELNSEFTQEVLKKYGFVAVKYVDKNQTQKLLL